MITNLQYFGGDNDKGNMEDIKDNIGTNNSDTSDTNNSGDSMANTSVDTSAFADIISEKDKQIQQLQKDIEELKRSNANLIVKVNSATNPAEPKKSFEETLLDMVGARPRKE